jgi:soluble lytic murein transglycosylase
MKSFSTNMLFQPDINLNLGTKYIRDLLNQHGGSVEQTLASYNAGKSRTDLWRTWGNFREPAEFIETVPFSETRNYIQSVLRNADFYRRLYEGRKAEVISMDGPIPTKSFRTPAKPAAKPAAKRKPAPKKKVRK